MFDPMDEGVAAWRRQVACPPPLVAPFGGSGQVARPATRCRDGTDVVVYELAAMGHARPGATIDDPMSAPDTPISASDLLWEFFRGTPATARLRDGPCPVPGARPLVLRFVREQPTPNPDPVSATIPTAHLGV